MASLGSLYYEAGVKVKDLKALENLEARLEGLKEKRTVEIGLEKDSLEQIRNVANTLRKLSKINISFNVADLNVVQGITDRINAITDAEKKAAKGAISAGAAMKEAFSEHFTQGKEKDISNIQRRYENLFNMARKISGEDMTPGKLLSGRGDFTKSIDLAIERVGQLRRAFMEAVDAAKVGPNKITDQMAKQWEEKVNLDGIEKRLLDVRSRFNSIMSGDTKTWVPGVQKLFGMDGTGENELLNWLNTQLLNLDHVEKKLNKAYGDMKTNATEGLKSAMGALYAKGNIGKEISLTGLEIDKVKVLSIVPAEGAIKNLYDEIKRALAEMGPIPIKLTANPSDVTLIKETYDNQNKIINQLAESLSKSLGTQQQLADAAKKAADETERMVKAEKESADLRKVNVVGRSEALKSYLGVTASDNAVNTKLSEKLASLSGDIAMQDVAKIVGSVKAGLINKAKSMTSLAEEMRTTGKGYTDKDAQKYYEEIAKQAESAAAKANELRAAMGKGDASSIKTMTDEVKKLERELANVTERAKLFREAPKAMGFFAKGSGGIDLVQPVAQIKEQVDKFLVAIRGDERIVGPSSSKIMGKFNDLAGVISGERFDPKGLIEGIEHLKGYFSDNKKLNKELNSALESAKENKRLTATQQDAIRDALNKMLNGWVEKAVRGGYKVEDLFKVAVPQSIRNYSNEGAMIGTDDKKIGEQLKRYQELEKVYAEAQKTKTSMLASGYDTADLDKSMKANREEAEALRKALDPVLAHNSLLKTYMEQCKALENELVELEKQLRVLQAKGGVFVGGDKNKGLTEEAKKIVSGRTDLVNKLSDMTMTSADLVKHADKDKKDLDDLTSKTKSLNVEIAKLEDISLAKQMRGLSTKELDNSIEGFKKLRDEMQKAVTPESVKAQLTNYAENISKLRTNVSVANQYDSSSDAMRRKAEADSKKQADNLAYLSGQYKIVEQNVKSVTSEIARLNAQGLSTSNLQAYVSEWQKLLGRLKAETTFRKSDNHEAFIAQYKSDYQRIKIGESDARANDRALDSTAAKLDMLREKYAYINERIASINKEINDRSNLNKTTTQLEQAQRSWENLANAMRNAILAKDIAGGKNLLSEIGKTSRQESAARKSDNEIDKDRARIDELGVAIRKVDAIIADLGDRISKSLGTSEVQNLLNYFIRLRSVLNNSLMSSAPSAKANALSQYKSSKVEVEDYKRLSKEATVAASSLDKLRASEEKLSNEASKLKTFKQSLNDKGIDTKNVDRAIQRYERLLQAIRNVIAAGDTAKINKHAQTIDATVGRARTEAQNAKTLDRQLFATSAYERELARANDAALKHQDILKDIVGQTFSLNNMFGQLGMTIQNAFSVTGLQQFAQQIIQVGGEIEKQKLAMGSIFGSNDRSEELYGKLSKLSMISPFDVEDIMKYSKQLAAFGIQYDDLYDTTKRLADVAAGVGVDFGRIAYEFGQTSARGWLDARELRMFANSGIPLLQKLSDYYTKIRGEKVSTSDVRTMISNREVSFADVKTVMWDMTNEGGTFYQMQEVMAESLAAKWRNLGNAWNLMLAELAQNSTGGEWLKDLATYLTSLTQKWREIVPVIASMASALAIAKLGAFGAEKALKAENAALIQQEITTKRAAGVAKLRQAIRSGDRAQIKAVIAEQNALTASELRGIAVQENMSKTQLALAVRSGALGKSFSDLSKRGKIATLIQAGYTKEQIRSIIGMNSMKAAVIGLGTSFRTLAVSMLTSPVGWIMAIGAGVGYLINKYNEYYALQNKLKEIESEHSKEMEKSTGTLKFYIDRLNDKTASEEEQIEIRKKLSSEYGEYFNNLDLESAKIEDITAKYDEATKAIERQYETKKKVAKIEAIYENYSPKLEKESSNIKDYVTKLTGNDAIGESVAAAVKRMTDNGLSAKEILDKIGETHGISFDNVKDRSLTKRKQFSGFMGALIRYYSQFTKQQKEIADASKGSGVELVNQYADEIREAYQEKAKEAKTYVEKNNILLEGEEQILKLYTGNGGKKIEAPNGKEYQTFESMFIPGDKEVKEAEARIAKLKETIGEGWRTVANTTVEGIKKLYLKEGDLNSEISTEAIKNALLPRDNDTFENYVSNLAKQYENDKKQLKILKDRKKEISDLGKYWDTLWTDTEEKQLLKLEEKVRVEDKLQKDLVVKYSNYTSGGSDNKSTTTKDKEAEKLKNQLNLLKDMYQEYEKISKITSDTTASQKVLDSEIMKARLDDIKKLAKSSGLDISADLANFDFTDGSYKKLLEKLKDEALRLVNSSNADNREARSNVYQQICKLLGLDIPYNEMQKAAEKTKNDAQKIIDEMRLDYDFSKQMRDATGKADYALENFSTLLRKSLVSQLQSGLADNKVFGDLGQKFKDNIATFMTAPDWSEYFKMDDQTLKNTFDKASDLIQTFLKSWHDATQNEVKEQQQTLLELQKSAKDAFSQTAVALDEYTRQIQYINNSEYSDDIKQRLTNIVDSNFNQKLLELDSRYTMLMSNIFAVTKQEVSSIGKAIENNLKKQLDNGTISAKEYADKMDEILKKTQEFDKIKNPFAKFFTEGMDSMLQQLQEVGKSQMERGASQVQAAQSWMNDLIKSFNDGEMDSYSFQEQMSLAESNKIGGEEFAQAGSEMSAAAGEAMNVIAIIDTIMKGINQALHGIQKMVDYITEAREALGKDVSADSTNGKWSAAVSILTNQSDAILSGWESFKSGDMVGALAGVVGSITTPIVGAAKYHDARYNERIEESSKRLTELSNSAQKAKESFESFGKSAALSAEQQQNLESLLNKQMRYLTGERSSTTDYLKKYTAEAFSKGFIRNSKDARIALEAYNALVNSNITKESKNRATDLGKAYMSQYESIVAQRYELEKQIRYEDSKKNTDSDAIKEYKEQLSELNKQMEEFVVSMYQELYELDLTEWAGNISDALTEAFLNGENSVNAFKDSVNDMLKTVAKNVLAQYIQQRYLDGLWKQLFGDEENEGILKITGIGDPQSQIKEALAYLAQWRDKYGEEIAALGDTVNQEMADMGVLDTSSSSSLSSSIKGVTEETADILAAYLNAIRLDVSVQRTCVEDICYNQLPEFNAIAESQLSQLNMIAEHTRLTAEHTSLCAEYTEEVRDIFKSVTTGVNKIYIN